MFHRVKSETPKEEDQSRETEELKTAQDTAEEQEEETSAEDEAEETESSDDTEQESSAYKGSSSPYARSSGAPRTSGYPGSGAYSGPSSYAPKSAPAQQSTVKAAAEKKHQPQDRTLTIGAGITMSGEIESCDNLVVEGTVEAALKGARNLDIAESGTFFGSVDIEQATIAGRFEGEITVHGRLVLKAGGVITGTIVYGELEIEAGSLIEGRLTPIAAGQKAQQPAPTKGQSSSQKQQVARVGNASQSSPANAEGGLLAAEA